MTAGARERAYRAAAGVSWVVQDRGVEVLDEAARRSQRLGYPEAAVWELLLRGHDVPAAAEMLRWVLDVPPEEARELVERCLGEWTRAGWLEASGREAG